MKQPEREDSWDPPVGDHALDEELEGLLAEAEERIQRLRAELVRRRRESLVDQHAEVARLSEHLENAQVNWQLVREFFRSAIEEQRAGAPWGEPLSAHSDDSVGRND